MGYAEQSSYSIYWEIGQVFVLRHTVSDIDSETNYIETDVQQGLTYKFAISATNTHGEGILSEPLVITVAAVPDLPTNLVLVSADIL